MHPRRRGPCPARELGAGASPRSFPRSEPQSTRLSTPPPSLPLPRAPASSVRRPRSSNRILILPPTTTRAPCENFVCVSRAFVHILGRAGSAGWAPGGIRALTMHWGSHRGNPTLLFLTRFYSRVTARSGEQFPCPGSPLSEGEPGGNPRTRRLSRLSREKRCARGEGGRRETPWLKESL